MCVCGRVFCCRIVILPVAAFFASIFFANNTTVTAAGGDFFCCCSRKYDRSFHLDYTYNSVCWITIMLCTRRQQAGSKWIILHMSICFRVGGLVGCWNGGRLWVVVPERATHTHCLGCGMKWKWGAGERTELCYMIFHWSNFYLLSIDGHWSGLAKVLALKSFWLSRLSDRALNWKSKEVPWNTFWNVQLFRKILSNTK